jgi:hypothetical protein
MGGSPVGGATPTKDYGASIFLQNQNSLWGDKSNGPQSSQPRLSLSLGIGTNLLTGNVPPPTVGGPVLVRKVTRTSPDSDDTDTIGDGDVEVDADDAFLIGSDRNESRYYGSVHAGGAPRGLSRWEKQMR